MLEDRQQASQASQDGPPTADRPHGLELATGKPTSNHAPRIPPPPVRFLLSRRRREFTLYLSTRWDMTLERSAFRSAAAPALKQMLDARGVSFGYMDPRSDLGVEDLITPRGIDAVLVGAAAVKTARVWLVAAVLPSRTLFRVLDSLSTRSTRSTRYPVWFCGGRVRVLPSFSDAARLAVKI